MILFTNPTVEALAQIVCKSHNGDSKLKMVGPDGRKICLLSNADEKTQDMLLQQADHFEKVAKAYRAAHAFNEMALIMGTEVEER